MLIEVEDIQAQRIYSHKTFKTKWFIYFLIYFFMFSNLITESKTSSQETISLDLCHNSASARSYFEHTKVQFCGENVSQWKKYFEHTKINFAFLDVCRPLFFCAQNTFFFAR